MDCVFEKIAESQWECQRCHARYNYLPVRQCDADPEKQKPEQLTSPTASDVPANRGPGDYLHGIIIRWTGEVPTEDCQCRSRIAQMNAWGPAGCRVHLDEIVEWLAEEAKNRGWWRYAVAVLGSRLLIRFMVLRAIVKSEYSCCASG